MRKRSLSTATACAVILSSTAALGVATAGAATAAAPRTAGGPVTVAGYGGITVDGALQRVFVGDSTNGTITAADYNGAGIATVSGISGVTDLAVSTDGATLYAAAGGTHEIVALNASTLAVETRYAVATTLGPTHVGFTSGKLWFTYGDQWDGNLGSVDPAAANPVTLGQFPAPGVNQGLWNPAIISTTPSEPGVLALAQSGLSSDAMAIVDVSDATPTLTARYSGDGTLNWTIGDMELVPGGSQVLVNGNLLDTYANGGFTKAGTYPAAQLAAVSPDGYVAQSAGGTVSILKPNARTPLHTYAAGSTGAADLAWAPDDSHVFAMEATPGWTGPFTLKSLVDPTKYLPTLTATAPATGVRGKAFTVSGRLTSTLPLPSGIQLSVTRVDLAHPAGAPLPVRPVVAADGSWHFSDTATIGGPFTYRVGYAGDATHAAVTASAGISIARATPALSVSSNATGYAYNGWARVTAHLGTTFNGRTVTLTAQPSGLGSTNFATGTVDRYGNFSAWYKVTRNTRFSAWFGGDYFYGTAWAGRWVNGYAAIADVFSGSYGSAWYAGTKYQLVHRWQQPVVATAVGPNKAYENLSLTVESYYSGGWHFLGESSWFALNGNGAVGIRIILTGLPVGGHFRIVPKFGGDNINAATYGSWLYFGVTN